MTQNGTPDKVLQEMGGWKTAEMVQRYAHLASHHLAPYAAKLDMDRLTIEQAGVKLATMKPANMDTEAHGTNTAQLPNAATAPLEGHA